MSVCVQMFVYPLLFCAVCLCVHVCSSTLLCSFPLFLSCSITSLFVCKVAKERAACVAAHKRASECFLQSEGGLFHAAKHLESAARESDSAVVRKELLQKAAAISRENGGHDKVRLIERNQVVLSGFWVA